MSSLARFLSAVLAFVLGSAVSVAVWMAWAGHCADNCPAKSVVGMLVFLALLPPGSLVAVVVLQAMRWPRRAKLAVGGALLAIAAVVGICLAEAGPASATVSGLR